MPQGFMETFDSAMVMAQSGYVRQRIEGGLRDESGRFRIAAGTSSLNKPDPSKAGISIEALQAQARWPQRGDAPLSLADARAAAASAGASGATSQSSGQEAQARGEQRRGSKRRHQKGQGWRW